MSNIKRFDRFTATFSPSGIDEPTFRQELRPWIGKTIEVQAYWICDDNERFPGQWAMWCAKLLRWFPEEELSNLTAVDK